MGISQSGTGTTSLSMIDRVRQQSADAWRKLVDVYGPVVGRWCRRAGLSAEEADDVGQDVFQAVATHIAAFRRDRPGDSFRGWLWTVRLPSATPTSRAPLLELLKVFDQLPPNPDWPPDGAEQHDHYLYGTPKRP